MGELCTVCFFSVCLCCGRGGRHCGGVAARTPTCIGLRKMRTVLSVSELFYVVLAVSRRARLDMFLASCL